MAGGEEGMSPAELRALPVVIHEKPLRSHRPEGTILGSPCMAFSRQGKMIASYMGVVSGLLSCNKIIYSIANIGAECFIKQQYQCMGALTPLSHY